MQSLLTIEHDLFFKIANSNTIEDSVTIANLKLLYGRCVVSLAFEMLDRYDNESKSPAKKRRRRGGGRAKSNFSCFVVRQLSHQNFLIYYIIDGKEQYCILNDLTYCPCARFNWALRNQQITKLTYCEHLLFLRIRKALNIRNKKYSIEEVSADELLKYIQMYGQFKAK